MTYDDAGNILSRKKYSYATGTLGGELSSRALTYGSEGWGDVLATVDGINVSSDSSGNILYDGASTYTWENGRQLARMSKSGVTWNFFYDASGMRTQRTNGSTTYTYIYDGSTLSQMTVGNNTLIFAYGANGHPMGVKYNGTSYYYVTNAFGDVLAIVDNSGTEWVTYTYDAWGNILSTGGNLASTLGKYNPLRYRGYVYDEETKLYYLQSRYYNPDICRFISADSIGYLGADGTPVSYNLFAYCGNNPVSNYDPTGCFLLSTAVVTGMIIGGLIGATVGGVVAYTVAEENGAEGWELVGWTVLGVVGGGAAGAAVGAAAGYGVGVALGAKASSGLVVKSISKALSSVSRNTMHHIMQSKHAWGQVLKRTTWNNVKSLINTTMQKGATTLINKQGSALIYEAVRNNIVVRYAVIDGIIKISDAWVKTR